MNTIDYQAEARKFLRDTQTSLKIELSGYMPYFVDDKESRNVYRFTLKRHGKSYTGRFGQSIAATENNETPTAYDILSCLTKNDPGTFEDFCSEFGYDTDSRKAEKTYTAVVKEYKGVSRVFDGVMTELELIQ